MCEKRSEADPLELYYMPQMNRKIVFTIRFRSIQQETLVLLFNHYLYNIYKY